MNSNKTLWISLIVVAIIAIGGYIFPHAQSASPLIGNATPGTRFPDGITVGKAINSPTNVADMKVGSGSLISSNFSLLAASSSFPFDIAVSGVVSTDLVFAQFATSSGAGAGWLITGASASTTAGFITLGVVNNTGAVATIPASIASTTKYMVVKTQ